MCDIDYDVYDPLMSLVACTDGHTSFASKPHLFVVGKSEGNNYNFKPLAVQYGPLSDVHFHGNVGNSPLPSFVLLTGGENWFEQCINGCSSVVTCMIV